MDDVVAADRAGVGRLIGLAFVALVAFSAFEVTLPLFGRARLGFGQVSTGAVFAGVGILLAVVQGGFVRPVVARIGEGGAVRGGLALNAAGLVLLAAVHSWWVLVPALAALTVGQGLAMPALTSVVAGRAHAHRRGGVLGVQQSAGGLARVVGPIAGGAAFQHIGVAAPYVGGAVLMAACAAAAGATAAARS
jgi:DHA1 family tetracycline resistance protein-like MFS transporter